MKSQLAIGLAALALLAACNKSGGGDQDNANASASSAGGDQKITLAEFQQRRVDRIMAYDTNHDGKVSKDELVAGMQARMAQFQGGGDDGGGQAPDPQAIADRMFPRMDTNGDGFITKDEVQKSAADQFARLDTDHKGYITRDQMRARFAGRGGGGQGGGGDQAGGQGGGDNGGGGGNG